MQTLHETDAGASPQIQENPGTPCVAVWNGGKRKVSLFRDAKGALFALEGEEGKLVPLLEEKWLKTAKGRFGEAFVYGWGYGYLEARLDYGSESWSVRPLNQAQYGQAWLHSI